MPWAFSRQEFGTFAWGFLFYAAFACIVLAGLMYFQRSWTRTWVGPWGRATGRYNPPQGAVAAE